MRIIGGHDYYDSGLAWGRDDAVTFLRNGNRRMSDEDMHHRLRLPYGICSARLGEKDQQARSWRSHGGHALGSVEIRQEGRAVRHEVAHAHVVLCGTLHHGVVIRRSEPYGVPRDLGRKWIWRADALRAYAVENGLELHEGAAGTDKSWEGSHARVQVDVPVEDLESWFTPRRLPDAVITALVAERITIASMNPEEHAPRDDDGAVLTWRIDQPGLSDMEFAKAVDPYTAFQEISMWKGGVLPADGPAMVEITDDKVKLAKAGFHDPTSFRRAKQGRSA